MADGVKTTFTDKTVISALNTPGGAVHDWREEVLADLREEFAMVAPEGVDDNRSHDRGSAGNYMASQNYDRRGSSGHHVVARMWNSAFYAEAVEFGRRSTRGEESWERFGWRKHKPSGAIRWHPSGTSGYEGFHTQRDVTNAVMPRHMDGYAPLP